MKKQLHSIFFLLSFISTATIYAQTERIKSAKQQVIIENNTTEVNNLPVNKPEKIEISKSNTELKRNTIQLRITDTTRLLKKENNRNKEVNLNQIIPTTNNDNNVTYTKEEVAPSTSSNTMSETRKVKVQKSVNYQPKVIKEDIHPIADYSNTSTPANKKIYLQQEADDLQIEINQNRNNTAYDLLAKQKQLNEIKKQIQQ